MTLTARQLRQPPTIEAIERVPYFADMLIALELTMESTTEPYTETDPFAYSMAIAIASRYTLTVFIGIMINIGALYKSIASYG